MPSISDLNVYGLWAYDTVWPLAMVAEGVGVVDPGYSARRTLRNLTDLIALRVSKTG